MFGKISACLMAILLLASGIIGQSTFGSIVGVVKDPGEGTIADAQITLTNSHGPGFATARLLDCRSETVSELLA
jgi:hypothetical protein